MVNKKVLVIDDERELTKSLDGFLTALGYEMLTAFGGQEALDVIKANKLDLLLLDIRMQGVDGFQVIKEVRKTNPEIKIIAFSAFGKEVKEKVEKLGVDGFFDKPIVLMDLMDKMRMLLEPSLEKKESPEDKEPLVKKTPKAKLLFIEPSPMSYGFMCGYFAGQNHMAEGDYEVKVVYHVEESLRELFSYQPDIVIMYDCFFDPKDAKEFASIMLNSSHKPKAVILHSLIPRSPFDVIELERQGIKFCNQNIMDDGIMRATNKKLVDFVKQECLQKGLTA